MAFYYDPVNRPFLGGVLLSGVFYFIFFWGRGLIESKPLMINCKSTVDVFTNLHKTYFSLLTMTLLIIQKKLNFGYTIVIVELDFIPEHI
jgi:hypothetical protein